MKFREYDTVKVMVDLGEEVRKGEIGVVLMAFEIPYEAYEVEFLDKDGNPKAQYALRPNELEMI